LAVFIEYGWKSEVCLGVLEVWDGFCCLMV
jgi:hypothetical protein